jgi:acetyltransferase
VKAADHRVVTTIRPISGDDKAALTRFHARLSPESRYRRYHGAKGDLTRADLRWLTEVDGVAHVACVAVDEAGEIDAVGRVVADANGRHAELAVVVADDRRGLDLGARVTRAALAAFYAQGHPGPVTALVQCDNHRALRLFDRLGARTAGSCGSAVELELPRAARSARRPLRATSGRCRSPPSR